MYLKPSAEGLVANFRDFVTNEKQRLAQRKQAMVKTEMDKRKADLVKFSKTFKVSLYLDRLVALNKQ
jgi:hypothetical protein